MPRTRLLEGIGERVLVVITDRCQRAHVGRGSSAATAASSAGAPSAAAAGEHRTRGERNAQTTNGLRSCDALKQMVHEISSPVLLDQGSWDASGESALMAGYTEFRNRVGG